MKHFRIIYSVPEYYRRISVHKDVESVVNRYEARLHDLFPKLDKVALEIQIIENPGMGQNVHSFHSINHLDQSIGITLYEYVVRMDGDKLSDPPSSNEVAENLASIFDRIIEENGAHR